MWVSRRRGTLAHVRRTEEDIRGGPAANGLRHVPIAIVGSGFSGIGMGMRLAQLGWDGFLIFEREADLGGTWRDNAYPGCQCDVPSHLYSFSFALNPDWSRTYSPQEEIWEYLRDCAERSGVAEHVRYGHEVQDACWEPGESRWHLRTAGGPYTADALIFANGALAEPKMPELPGAEAFEGRIFHSADWDHEHDLSGERVAVIGTGASAIQIVPTIQPRVERLSVFQRTPAWVLPHRDRPITGMERRLYRRFPILQRLVRALVYWLRELIVIGMVKRPDRMRALERLARKHLRDQVDDPELRERLTPDYSPGCKRLLPSNAFYPALTEENVELVTEPIREVRGRSIVTADGIEHPVDTIVCATGFHVTDNPMLERVRGREGRSVAEHWSETGMRAYLGTTIPGFPNLFLMTGPNTGIGHTSLVVMIEGQIDYVLDALGTMARRGIHAVEVRPEVLARFDTEIQSKMQETVWTTGGCVSWYLDDEGRNPTLWPDFTWRYRLRTRRFDLESYEVVETDRRTAPEPAPLSA